MTDASPPNGLSSGNTTVVVEGYGFYRNSPDLKCRFGDQETKATFVSSTSVTCAAPGIDMGTKESKSVPFSISLDGITYTDPNNKRFTYIACPGGCTDSCAAEECRCDVGFYGSQCQHECSCEPLHSTGCGSLSGVCHCDQGWVGASCALSCPGVEEGEGICGGGGACYESEGNSECVCFEGFWGEACDGVCPKDAQGKVCGGKGDCEQNAGKCVCGNGWYGDVCEVACPGVAEGGGSCGGNGVCCTGMGVSLDYTPCTLKAVGQCTCDAGFQGDACGERFCFQDCYDHGVCSEGVCSCEEGWGGEFCSLESGSDPSLSYFEFSAPTYYTSESIGTISVNVTRYGSLMNDVR